MGGTAFPVFPLKIGKKASDSDEIKVEGHHPGVREERRGEQRRVCRAVRG